MDQGFERDRLFLNKRVYARPIIVTESGEEVRFFTSR